MWVLSNSYSLSVTTPDYLDFLHDQSPESLPSQVEFNRPHHQPRDVCAMFNTVVRSAAVAEGKTAGERHTRRAKTPMLPNSKRCAI